jgi:crotonobetainyl-CoA:carnitine CoA-transferase CaiB-like acyl-CoA transferase
MLAGGWATPRRAAAPTGAPRVGRPLEGLNVLDFGMFLAGPYGPQLMADLGAELVKVEATTGDRLRRIERVFAGCNRGKRSLAIDLRDPATRPVLAQLVEWADVVHHNLRMPAARRLGLDYETVRAMKPSIVYCHVSSYGPEGPRRDWAGVDPTSQAVVGWMQEGAGPGNPARWLRIGMTDDQCAMLSVVAVLLALRHRDRTGEGMDVRGSILGGAVLTTSETLLLADGTYAPYAQMDADETGFGPGYRIYECNGGWVAVAALGDEQHARLREATGASDDDEIAARVRTRAPENVASALEAVGVPAEVVRLDHEDAFFDSELNRAIGLTVAYEHAEYGETEQIGALWDFGDQSLRLDRPPPALGQHTTEILAEIGVDDATVARLAASALVAGPGLPRG